MLRPRIKICCIASEDEAARALDAGADALGLVGPMPSGPGVIDTDTARRIAARVPPPITAFLLTSETTAPAIAEHVLSVGAGAVQIVAPVDPSELERLRTLLPAAIRRIQVVHVEGPEALEQIAPTAPFVHAFLLDSGRPSAPVAELGGTGRRHDWSISADFVRQSPVPVFLAGGLTAATVAEAVTTVRPFGLDLCSGVRTDGHLDSAKLTAFMAAARTAS